jgi:hypothetical protein
MKRTRNVAITARAPGMGLTVDFQTSKETTPRAPRAPVRVVYVERRSPAPVRRQPARTSDTPPSLTGGLFWKTPLGLFFGYVSALGGGPIAWLLTVVLLIPAGFRLFLLVRDRLRAEREEAPVVTHVSSVPDHLGVEARHLANLARTGPQDALVAEISIPPARWFTPGQDKPITSPRIRVSAAGARARDEKGRYARNPL